MCPELNSMVACFVIHPARESGRGLKLWSIEMNGILICKSGKIMGVKTKDILCVKQVVSMLLTNLKMYLHLAVENQAKPKQPKENSIPLPSTAV